MKPETLITRRIWTVGNRPFVMGGDVHYPLACDHPCTGPHLLGKGFKGYLATGPDGRTRVAEAESGAVVGSTLAAVRADIKAAKPEMMRGQVADAISFCETRQISLSVKDVATWWGMMRG